MLPDFFKRAWNKPPIVFPLVALFHLVIVLHALWTFSDLLVADYHSWLYPGVLLLYLVLWLFVCDLRKWAAYVYILLMLADVLSYFYVPSARDYAGVLFPANIIFAVLILVYFRKFE